MKGQITIAIALPGFNDLGRTMTPSFLAETDFIKKKSKFLSTGHRILTSCGCKVRETMSAKYELVF